MSRVTSRGKRLRRAPKKGIQRRNYTDGLFEIQLPSDCFIVDSDYEHYNYKYWYSHCRSILYRNRGGQILLGDNNGSNTPTLQYLQILGHDFNHPTWTATVIVLLERLGPVFVPADGTQQINPSKKEKEQPWPIAMAAVPIFWNDRSNEETATALSRLVVIAVILEVIQAVTLGRMGVSRGLAATTAMKTTVDRTVVPIIRTKTKADRVNQGLTLVQAVENRSIKRVENQTMERRTPFLRLLAEKL